MIDLVRKLSVVVLAVAGLVGLPACNLLGGGNTNTNDNNNVDELEASISSPEDGFEARVGDPITFTAAATGGVPPYSFAWDFADGSLGTDDEVSKNYSAEGEYEVTVTVSDAENTEATATITVTITPAVDEEVGFALFTDAETETSTTRVRDIDGETVRFRLADDALVYEDGTIFDVGSWPVDGNFLGSAAAFQVRFGTENELRQAYFTETGPATICDYRVQGESFLIFPTSQAVPQE